MSEPIKETYTETGSLQMQSSLKGVVKAGPDSITHVLLKGDSDLGEVV